MIFGYFFEMREEANHRHVSEGTIHIIDRNGYNFNYDSINANDEFRNSDTDYLTVERKKNVNNRGQDKFKLLLIFKYFLERDKLFAILLVGLLF